MHWIIHKCTKTYESCVYASHMWTIFTHELSITHVYKQLTSNIEYLNDYELFPSAMEHSQVN